MEISAKKKVLIFGGTSEGRSLAAFCEKNKIPAYISVATEYGESLLQKGTYTSVLSGRMDESELLDFIHRQGIEIVADMTHPYAKLVTAMIKKACEQSGIRLLRYVRDEGNRPEGETPSLVEVADAAEAVKYLKNLEGNIMLTTGSKDLQTFAKGLSPARLFPRVLPSAKSLEACERAGLPLGNVIAAQGPFSAETNLALLRQYDCRFLVTKDGGAAGGFSEKAIACQKAGAIMVVISRPTQESGYSYGEICSLLEHEYGEGKPEIAIAGIGMGNPGTLTVEVKELVQRADVLIGGDRILDSFPESGKTFFRCYQAKKIREFIEQQLQKNKNSRIVVLMSGDVGFYSGARLLLKELEKPGTLGKYQITCYPGISTPAYFAAKLGMPWQDMVMCSAHGSEEGNLSEIISLIFSHEKVFVLSGNSRELPRLGAILERRGLGSVEVFVGEKLSYPEERLWHGTAEKMQREEFSSLSAAVFINHIKSSFLSDSYEKAGDMPSHAKSAAPEAQEPPGPGIPDREFIRGSVPMTKEEIRWLSVVKLRLRQDSVVYDIGAGTGSVSVEMARLTPLGQVYAVEKNPMAVSLVEQNRQKFGLSNLKIIEGTAPDAIRNLPAPTHAFIGGSSGNLRAILSCLTEKNPRIRIAITSISLETAAELASIMKEYPMEIINVAVSRAKETGNLHLMIAQNPVYIAVLDCGSDGGNG